LFEGKKKSRKRSESWVMANDTLVYLIEEKVLLERKIRIKESAGEGIPLLEVVKKSAEMHKQREYGKDDYHRKVRDIEGYLREAGGNHGIFQIMHIQNVGGLFDDLKKLAPYMSPELHKRFFENDEDGYPPYSWHADFPEGIEGDILAFDFPAWQFFTKYEINELVGACNKIHEHGDKFLYDVEWRNLVKIHETRDYDYLLFVYQI
jgi:hypothetical protein